MIGEYPCFVRSTDQNEIFIIPEITYHCKDSCSTWTNQRTQEFLHQQEPFCPNTPFYTRVHTKFINGNRFVSKSFIDIHNKPVKFTKKNYREHIRFDDNGNIIGSWDEIITRV